MRAFRGEEAAGTWTLTICDEEPSADDGLYRRSHLLLRPLNTAVQTGSWFHTLTFPDGLDYVEQTLAIYGTDLVGNRTAEPVSLAIWVDNVTPVIAATQVVDELVQDPNRTPVTALMGTVTDGGRVSNMYALVKTPAGDFSAEQVARDGDEWWYDLRPGMVGNYIVWVYAVDAAGNVSVAGPYQVTVRPWNDIYLPLIFRD